MRHFRITCLMFLVLLLCRAGETTARADIVCDATVTVANEVGEESVESMNVYVKANKVKMERLDGSLSFVLRSDLQVLLNIFPAESAYHETNFSQMYTIPFGPMPFTISPGFGDPVVELDDTGETELIGGLSCKKYVITEISSFRLLQYTIYATDELVFSETFDSFFSSPDEVKYKPFEEMRTIPGLPLKIVINETVGARTYSQTYEFSNYQQSALDDSLFSVPAGYSPK